MQRSAGSRQYRAHLLRELEGREICSSKVLAQAGNRGVDIRVRHDDHCEYVHADVRTRAQPALAEHQLEDGRAPFYTSDTDGFDVAVAGRDTRPKLLEGFAAERFGDAIRHVWYPHAFRR